MVNGELQVPKTPRAVFSISHGLEIRDSIWNSGTRACRSGL